MRTTIALDDELIKQAEYYTGIKEKAALVREALTRLVRNEAARRLASLGGSDPAQGARVILVDTSVWIDHLRSPELKLQKMLLNDEVVTHPFIRLELALGSIAAREKVLADLALLPQASIAATGELFSLVELRRLYRRGVSITDLHLISSCLFDKSILIWTRDRRLGDIADEFGLRASLP
jgi:predicted nucleic acid-binding protein